MSSNVVFNNAHSQNNSSTSSAGSSHASSSGAASNNTNSTPAEAPRDGGDGNGNSETESLEELSRMDSGPGQTSPSQSGIARDAKQPLPQGQRRERRMANGEGDNNESFFDTDDQEDYTYHLNDPEPLCTKRCPHNCELWHPGSTPSGPRDLQGGLYCRKKKYIDHRRRDARVGTKKHIREYLRCVSPEDEDRPHCSSCLRGGAPDEQPSSSGQPDKKDGSKHQPAEYVGYIVGPIPAEWATSHTSGNTQAFDPRAPAFVPSNNPSTAPPRNSSTDQQNSEQAQVKFERQEEDDDKYTIRQWIQDGMRQELHRVKIESQSQSQAGAQARMRTVLDEWTERQRRLGYLSESPEPVIKREPVIKQEASPEPDVKREETQSAAPDPVIKLEPSPEPEFKRVEVPQGDEEPVIKDEGWPETTAIKREVDNTDSISLVEIPFASIPFREDLSNYSNQLRLKANLRRRDYWQTWTAYARIMSEQCLENFATTHGRPGWKALWAGQAKLAADDVELAGVRYAKAMLDDMEQVLVEQIGGREVSL